MAHNRQREGMAYSRSTDVHRVPAGPDTDTPSPGASVPGSDDTQCTSAYDAADTALSQYSQELVRLGSFSSWPVDHSIEPRTLAKAGLYYSGESDVVVCFSCHGQLGGWNDRESPTERHYREHKDCAFARELFEKERESKKSFDCADSLIRLPENLHCTDSSLSPFQRESVSPSSIDDKKKHEFIRTDTFCENSRNMSMQYVRGRANDADHVLPSSGTSKQGYYNASFIQTNNMSGQKTWTGAGSVSVQICGPNCPKDLNTEIHRIHTYFGWPDNVPVTPGELAKLGFFYLGVRDKVECAFCGGVLHQWERGDDPEVEHRRHYPHCPFMRNCATSNVPLLVGSD
ncbi:baculoviral IAP repeat-containing protein 3-like, partial [Branchiostoma floridae]|uniref:Baculoviral IAP repeat-containing protein 3-like n=1 Tax=Branchiostoma floridae TaxID=7739 RepID=A0A9J7KUM5_BRAFL